MQFAPLHYRIIAKIIDCLLCFGLFAILVTVLPTDFLAKIDSNYLFWIPLLLIDSIQGQSIGKRIMKIQIVNFKTSKPTGILTSIIRNLLFILNFLLIPLAINYILFTSYFRMIDDFVTKSCVIQKPKRSTIQT